MDKIRNGYWMVMAAIVLGCANSALADTDITAMTDGATTVWGSVKVLVIAIVTFFLLLGVVKLLKRGK